MNQEKKIKQKLEEAIRDRDNYSDLVDDYRRNISTQRANYIYLYEKVKRLEKEVEKYKKEAADATSLYYDTIQKLKNVMEETGYGKDL